MRDGLPTGRTPAEFSAKIFGADEPCARAAGLELMPFRGVRFAPEVVGDLAAVTAPPYDVLDTEAVERLRASDGHNIVRLILPEPGPVDPYEQANAILCRWRAEGALITDPEPALYVYEERDPARLQRGLIGGLGLRPESARVVLPHEDVSPGPVRDRLRLMEATSANLEPIFLLYRGGGAASDIVDETAGTPPLVDMDSGNGVTHRLWAITDPVQQARIAEDLLGRQALIADGHHRYATYRALQARRHHPGPWDQGLALLVDANRYPPQLSAIHRVLPDLTPETVITRAKEAFHIAELRSGLADALTVLASAADESAAPAFLVGGGDRIWLLSDPAPSRHTRRDTALLDRLLTEGVWDLGTQRNMELVHHDAVAALERAKHKDGTAVIRNPLRLDEVFALAGSGERVPQKSTSFGPKPRSGLVLRLFNP